MFHHHKRAKKATHVPCIFVHAGAGYHSEQNERIHLKACSDAASIAMKSLRNGCCAMDAVEMAIKVLEDREITNAGFGSNLTLDGVVECDAVVVDHLGRSGACGAVAQIKNPISLARLIFDKSMEELSLRRVPPNLLVGRGATDYADECGMPIVPHDVLISGAARERWARWKLDLEVAGRRETRFSSPASSHVSEAPTENGVSSPTPAIPDPQECVDKSTRICRDPRPHEAFGSFQSIDSNLAEGNQFQSTRSIYGHIQMEGKDDSETDHSSSEDDFATIRNACTTLPQRASQAHEDHQDLINDTVGAIAIDRWGNIACGASSGGIGMKHGGRIGPAALVGVGAAVVPKNEQDGEEACVGVVTSGTGEHMATTMAATTFAERMYSGVKKIRGGGLADCEDDDEIIRSVIEQDFMGHPGVISSKSTGAIGMLCVKKTCDGIALHFAHNTDSFAIASQAGNESKPMATMSRGKGNSTIALGGRVIRPRKR